MDSILLNFHMKMDFLGQDHLPVQILKSLCVTEGEKPGMSVHVCTKSQLFSACLWQLVSSEVLTSEQLKACECPCLFLELRKYQKLLEPPPSAKPITVDVDRKLEDGQKVTPPLCYRKKRLQGKMVACLSSVWSCCLQVFKQMVNNEMGLLKTNPHYRCGICERCQYL